jgi:hypothetical protein
MSAALPSRYTTRPFRDEGQQRVLPDRGPLLIELQRPGHPCTSGAGIIGWKNAVTTIPKVLAVEAGNISRPGSQESDDRRFNGS